MILSCHFAAIVALPFQTRYVFAYGMDNSDRPCYLLWPIRGGNGQFLLVDPWSGNYFDLEAAKLVKPIGIEHFFDAFSLEKKRPLKSDAASALNIQVKDVSDSLVVNQDKAKRFELTPVWAPAEPPAKRAKTAEVRLSSASNVPRPPQSDDNEKGSSEEEDSDSSGSNSDVSSQDDSSDVSDLEKFARETVHSDAQPNHLLLRTPYLCVTRTCPILSFLLSPAPPRHEYILNGTWRCHRTFPVASRYRYIPNTLSRKRSR